MRIIVFLLAAAVVSGPAAAQSWQDYSYPEYAFSVAFPATPNVETTTYQAANGRSVPARVYSVHQGNELLKVTVADLANTGLDEPAVIDHAIKMLSAGGVVTFNIPQRIYRVYGRSLGIQGGDGSRSMVGVFDYHSRLYQIEAKALPPPSASNSRSYLPMAGRIVLRKKFGRSGKVVPALLETPPAWTIHGVPGRGDNRCRHWMASQGIGKAPGSST